MKLSLKLPHKKKRSLFLLILSVLGVISAVFLIQRPQIFKPQAASTTSGYVAFINDPSDPYAISGWAKSSNHSGPIWVHIYVDGVLVQDVLADRFWDGAVGNHGFRWKYSPFGKGVHNIQVFGLGVDGAGNFNGDNFQLIMTGQALTKGGAINDGCNGLVGDELNWCNGGASNPNYWENRQSYTKLLWNPFIKIGINNSYGGMISQLYSNDTSYNLITEDGGAAMQLSLWGYQNSSSQSWFGDTSNAARCDPVAYSSETQCKQGGNVSCIQYPIGAHNSNCSTVRNCGGFPAGGPWNPLQAKGEGCLTGWDTATNDAPYAAPIQGVPNSWEIRKSHPYNYTKTDAFPGLHWNQKVVLGDVYAKVSYAFNYDLQNTYTMISPMPQEMPAIFAQGGVNQFFYYYGGNQPWTNGQVTTLTNPAFNKYLGLPNRGYYHHGTPIGFANEYWWGACDGSNTHCVTVATFSPLVKEAGIFPSADTLRRGAYLSPIGDFGFYPGFSASLDVYLFPYRYDQVVEGKSIRQRIYELSQGQITPTPTLSPSPTPTPSPTPMPPPPGEFRNIPSSGCPNSQINFVFTNAVTANVYAYWAIDTTTGQYIAQAQTVPVPTGSTGSFNIPVAAGHSYRVTMAAWNTSLTAFPNQDGPGVRWLNINHVGLPQTGENNWVDISCNITPTPTQRPGDVDNNGDVNLLDYVLLFTSYLKPTSDPNYDTRADFNKDSKVNFLDYVILFENFGS